MSDDPVETFVLAFADTPEFHELQDALDNFHAAPADETETIEVSIPKRYLTLSQFIEDKAATAENRSPVPLAEVLSKALTRQLETEKVTLSIERTNHPYYRQLWNRLADEHGLPEEKISDPGDTAPDESPIDRPLF